MMPVMGLLWTAKAEREILYTTEKESLHKKQKNKITTLNEFYLVPGKVQNPAL